MSMPAKQLLRKKIREKLNGLNADAEGRRQMRRESAVVGRKLLEHHWLLEARRLSIYVSMDTEIGTDEVIRWALREGKELFIPRFGKGKEPMEMLKLESEEAFDGLVRTTWGIRQHPPSAKPPSYTENLRPGQDALDLVIVPGLAFSRDGKRLGHGRGHYDLFLDEYERRSGKVPRTIGLALLAQLEEEVPMAAWDRRVDLVLHP